LIIGFISPIRRNCGFYQNRFGIAEPFFFF